jgi:hypothetical protein
MADITPTTAQTIEATAYTAFTTAAQNISNRNTSRAVGSFSPLQARMKIVRMSGAGGSEVFTNDFVICHYNPEEFTEELSASYQNLKVSGTAVQRIQFEFGNPRKWTMNLLFNEWGESAKDYPANRKSVDDSISALRTYALPLDGITKNSNWDARVNENPGAYAPPILGVLLTKEAIICHLTSMSVTRTKINPVTLETIRAMVQVEFTEYHPSEI